MCLDDHSVPVHAGEVEQDKVIKVTDELSVWDIGDRLNRGLLAWEHDYFFLYNPNIKLWFRISKLASLAPDPSTPSGALLVLQRQFNHLEAGHRRLRDQVASLKAKEFRVAYKDETKDERKDDMKDKTTEQAAPTPQDGPKTLKT